MAALWGVEPLNASHAEVLDEALAAVAGDPVLVTLCVLPGASPRLFHPRELNCWRRPLVPMLGGEYSIGGS